MEVDSGTRELRAIADDPIRLQQWLRRASKNTAKRTMGLTPDQEVPEGRLREFGALQETVRVTGALLLHDGLLASELALAFASGVSGGVEAYTASATRLTEKLAPKRTRSKALEKSAMDLADRIERTLETADSGEQRAMGEEEVLDG